MMRMKARPFLEVEPILDRCYTVTLDSSGLVKAQVKRTGPVRYGVVTNIVN